MAARPCLCPWCWCLWPQDTCSRAYPLLGVPDHFFQMRHVINDTESFSGGLWCSREQVVSTRCSHLCQWWGTLWEELQGQVNIFPQEPLTQLFPSTCWWFSPESVITTVVTRWFSNSFISSPFISGYSTAKTIQSSRFTYFSIGRMNLRVFVLFNEYSITITDRFDAVRLDSVPLTCPHQFEPFLAFWYYSFAASALESSTAPRGLGFFRAESFFDAKI